MHIGQALSYKRNIKVDVQQLLLRVGLSIASMVKRVGNMHVHIHGKTIPNHALPTVKMLVSSRIQYDVYV